MGLLLLVRSSGTGFKHRRLGFGAGLALGPGLQGRDSPKHVVRGVVTELDLYEALGVGGVARTMPPSVESGQWSVGCDRRESLSRRDPSHPLNEFAELAIMGDDYPSVRSEIAWLGQSTTLSHG
jgi:hypothetical protein